MNFKGDSLIYVKMSKMKFTFKTIKPTGKWRGFDKESYHILLNKKQVGLFYNQGEYWSITFMVMKTETITDDNPNCPWKWIQLKAKPKTLDEAKEFVNSVFVELSLKYKFHHND